MLSALLAQADATSRSWNQPVEPFKVIGNIHYVGANEITSFLMKDVPRHVEQAQPSALDTASAAE
jgi:hypothetical protein